MNEFEVLKAERFRLEMEECEKELRQVEKGTHKDLLAALDTISEEEQRELQELEQWKQRALASAELIRGCFQDEARRSFREELRLVKEELCQNLRRKEETIILRYLQEKQKPDLLRATEETAKSFPHLWEKHRRGRKPRAKQEADARKAQQPRAAKREGEPRQQGDAPSAHEQQLAALPPIIHKLTPYDIEQDLFLMQRTC